MKKMAVGGTTTKRIIKKSTGGMYGIPQENLGTSGQYGFAQKGGVVRSGIAKKIISTAKKSNPNIKNLYDKNGNKKSKAQFILQQMKTDLKNKTVKKYQRGGTIIKAIKKVVKKITRPTLRKAQNGIEMDDNMMINKPGYSGGYSNGAVSKVPVTPVRPRIGSGPKPASDWNSSLGKSGRPDSYERSKPRFVDPRTGPPSLEKPTKYKYVEPTSREKPVSVYYKKGGATKAAKFAALAPPYDKATFADKIVGAKKSASSKKLPKAQLGAIVKGIMGFKTAYKANKIVKQAAKKGNFKDWHNEMDILLKKSNPNIKKYIDKETVIKNFKKVIKSKPGDTYKSAVNLKSISPKPKNTYKSAVNLKNTSKVKVNAKNKK